MTKIVNVYIVYDSVAWTRNTLRIFALKNCLFRETNIAKNSDKEKYMHSGYGIVFYGNVMDFDYATNVILFGVDNSSPSHADNLMNNFLILGEWDTFVNNGNFGAPEKFSIRISRANTNFC